MWSWRRCKRCCFMRFYVCLRGCVNVFASCHPLLFVAYQYVLCIGVCFMWLFMCVRWRGCPAAWLLPLPARDPPPACPDLWLCQRSCSLLTQIWLSASDRVLSVDCIESYISFVSGVVATVGSSSDSFLDSSLKYNWTFEFPLMLNRWG